MSTSADIMLQLRLLVLLHTTSCNPTCRPTSVSSPIPIITPTVLSSPVRSPRRVSTRVHIPSDALTLTLSSDLIPAPLPHSPKHTRHGIPPRPFPLAGSCHQLHHRKKPTFISGRLHVALSWKYQFREHFDSDICRFYHLILNNL